MERRFEVRMEELLEGAVLDPRIPDGMLDRLEQFVQPFAAIMESPSSNSISGSTSPGCSRTTSGNAESIAYFHDQDRQALQKFVGQVLWDEACDRGIGAAGRGELGEPDGVLVFDPSGFKKQGQGVGRCRAAVVWPSGKDRKLPSGRLPGLRFPQGTRLGGRASVSEQGVGEGQAAAEEVRRSQ